jgi:hypothetical protein
LDSVSLLKADQNQSFAGNGLPWISTEVRRASTRKIFSQEIGICNGENDHENQGQWVD